MHLQIPDQLNCPICMSLFKIPITTQCGHSFCRSCLINSSKNRKACPICRQQFQSSPQKLKQDDVLSRILSDFMTHSLRSKKNKEDTSFETKSQNMLLLDVKTDQLLLPYIKILVTFELQNPILLNKCEKLVARQEYPYNKFGVISRIVALKRLRHNVYECTLEGKAFCVIEEDNIEQGVSETEEEFFYRTCKAKQIVETSNIKPNEFQQFLNKLKEIKDPEILEKIFKQVDYNVFLNGNDPLALVYSIFELIDIDDQEKYRILTLFDQQKRIEVIRNILKNFKHDVSFNVQGFIKVKREKGYSYSSLAIFFIIFALLYLINSGEGDL